MTPEQKARKLIDDQLHQTGWAVQSADEMDISAARGVAVREFALETGFADYLLYGDCKALGTIEAKPEGYTLTGVEPQSGKYSIGLPAGLPHFHLLLPFAYESTGSVTQFSNLLDPHARSREIFTFHRPEELIRLAIATGTDVKPLECLIFMRNINSAAYFEQMKGRGCRIIRSDDLQGVTPDAKQKTHFVIVDAVGVCERDKTPPKVVDRKPSVPLEKILNTVAAGAVSDEICSTLAARLTRLDRQVEEPQRAVIAQHTAGKTLADFSGKLLDAIDPDANVQRAVVEFNLPPEQEPTDEQIDKVERVARLWLMNSLVTLVAAITTARYMLDKCSYWGPVRIVHRVKVKLPFYWIDPTKGAQYEILFDRKPIPAGTYSHIVPEANLREQGGSIKVVLRDLLHQMFQTAGDAACSWFEPSDDLKTGMDRFLQPELCKHLCT
ncbi:MAG: hypothetical protein ABSG53_26430 [Thermoguttaceae bacterium]|jgi:type I site-specific restriction endonuclease